MQRLHDADLAAASPPPTLASGRSGPPSGRVAANPKTSPMSTALSHLHPPLTVLGAPTSRRSSAWCLTWARWPDGPIP